MDGCLLKQVLLYLYYINFSLKLCLLAVTSKREADGVCKFHPVPAGLRLLSD